MYDCILHVLLNHSPPSVIKYDEQLKTSSTQKSKLSRKTPKTHEQQRKTNFAAILYNPILYNIVSHKLINAHTNYTNIIMVNIRYIHNSKILQILRLCALHGNSERDVSRDVSLTHTKSIFIVLFLSHTLREVLVPFPHIEAPFTRYRFRFISDWPSVYTRSFSLHIGLASCLHETHQSDSLHTVFTL